MSWLSEDDIITDTHIHSRYSRGTSRNLTFSMLEKHARMKGIGLLGTGDFTHPKHFSAIMKELSDDGSGILRTKSGFPFVLQTEISLMYRWNGRGRRIHLLLYAPDTDAASSINEWLSERGRLDYDGRPIFGISAPELVEAMHSISNRIEIVPAHIWTPWFSLLGKKSGFDSVRECFEEQTRRIHAVETGLSSDPPMNWRVSFLDRFNLVSNSDAHSFWPWRLGREATVLKGRRSGISYKTFIRAIRNGDGLAGTVEVDPAYGKYHYDGHRKCGVAMDPEKAEEHENICPVCGKKLTFGVSHRVEELADRKPGFVRENARPFLNILPLSELIALSEGFGINTKRTWSTYHNLLDAHGSEFDVLLRTGYEELKRSAGRKLADIIVKNKAGTLRVNPGFDGEYGNIEMN